jgi:DNA-binding NarL/FixJ family response regulator
VEGQFFRILIVDDYEPWRRFATSALQNQPGLLIVGEAADGLRAVEQARELHPDLILLDISLPTLNGIEAARRIRQHSSNPRILFCSQNLSSDIAEKAFGTGAAGYVVKSDAASDLLPAVTAVLQGERFVSRRFAGCGFAQIQDTRVVRRLGHVVQFYKNDSVLLDGLAASLRGSLGGGESAAYIMTSSHRSSLEMRLIAQGIDMIEATENGRLVILDAHQALSEFMDAAGPSRERFLFQFGDRLRRLEDAAVAKNKRVVVFGEMVAVLWAQKRHDAAIRLEELWNELAQTCSFYLCCAYPLGAFREKEGVHYATICAQHSEVVSAA